VIENSGHESRGRPSFAPNIEDSVRRQVGPGLRLASLVGGHILDAKALHSASKNDHLAHGSFLDVNPEPILLVAQITG
jgi:hypothetical protein